MNRIHFVPNIEICHELYYQIQQKNIIRSWQIMYQIWYHRIVFGRKFEAEGLRLVLTIIFLVSTFVTKFGAKRLYFWCQNLCTKVGITHITFWYQISYQKQNLLVLNFVSNFITKHNLGTKFRTKFGTTHNLEPNSQAETKFIMLPSLVLNIILWYQICQSGTK